MSSYPVYQKEEETEVQVTETFRVETEKTEQVQLMPDASGIPEKEDERQLVPAGFQPDEPDYEPDYGRFDEPEEEKGKETMDDAVYDAFNVHVDR